LFDTAKYFAISNNYLKNCAKDYVMSEDFLGARYFCEQKSQWYLEDSLRSIK